MNDKLHRDCGALATRLPVKMPEEFLPVIARMVAEEFVVHLHEMRHGGRPARLAQARQVAMFLGREFTDASPEKIGDYFGHRAHDTVLYGCKAVIGWMGQPGFEKDTAKVTKVVGQLEQLLPERLTAAMKAELKYRLAELRAEVVRVEAQLKSLGAGDEN